MPDTYPCQPLLRGQSTSAPTQHGRYSLARALTVPAQGRARPPRELPDPGGGPAGDLRVRGSLLQPPAPAFRPRLLDPGPGLRADGQGRVTHLTPPSTPAGQAHHRRPHLPAWRRLRLRAPAGEARRPPPRPPP